MIKRHNADEETKQDIIFRISKELEKRPEILFAYIYGSFLEKGFFRDIDIAIYVELEVRVEDYFRYENDIGNEIERAIGKEFNADVRIINGSPIVFKYHAIKGRLIDNKNDERRIEFVSHVLSRYFDLRGILHYYQKEAFNH
jgi:predicted nucleotidyltransferase